MIETHRTQTSAAAGLSTVSHTKELEFARTLLERTEIPEAYQWDLSAIFPTVSAWESAFDAARSKLNEVSGLKGQLGDSAETLFKCLELRTSLGILTERLMAYGSLEHDMDTRAAAPRERSAKAGAFASEVAAGLAFTNPEIIALGRARVDAYVTQDSRLRTYAHTLNDLFRHAEHLCSAEVEQVLGAAGSALSASASTAETIVDTDLKFGKIESTGEEITAGTVERLLAHGDRDIRREAWEKYCDGFRSMENSLAACYQGEVRSANFYAKVRRHDSSLAMTLFASNLPSAVFTNTIEACQRNAVVWHRYWQVLPRVLGVERLGEYDIHAPLPKSRVEVPYSKAVEFILEALTPLGTDYVEKVRKGLLEERWADVFATRGKRSNAYSWGVQEANPFILLNWANTVGDASTHVHEIGHGMHSKLSAENQPPNHRRYALFVAEIASNCNQALLRHHLLKQGDRDFKLAVLEETMANFHRYLFIMPTLARIEYEAHTRVQHGDGLSAATLKEMTVRLFSEGYGGHLEIDADRLGTTWAQFQHLYRPYYTFQYTTGISAANVFAADILAEKPGARDRYLTLLKSGDSKYALDLIREAGVDLSTQAPIDRAFEVLSGHIEMLEQLADRQA
jgi:oligoendopeptidase F